MANNDIQQVAAWLKGADALVITAGAGMGVDSGLSDYRGENGLWGSVESTETKSVFELVNPQAMLENPDFCWRLQTKRILQYAETKPHLGFQLLQGWIERFKLDYFVLTSNVDNQFQKSGFSPNRIREVHGSLFYSQCSKPCSEDVWFIESSPEVLWQQVENKMYPVCKHCGEAARPNVYMFRDKTYIAKRSEEQDSLFAEFLNRNAKKKMLVFEIGSGPHVQSIRMKTRMLAREYDARVVRINIAKSEIKLPHIGLAMGALQALTDIDAALD